MTARPPLGAGALTLALLLAHPGAVAAQGVRFGIAARIAAIESRDGTRGDRWLALGGEGRVALAFVTLGAGYLEGRAVGGNRVPGSTIVEGFAELGVAPVAGLAIAVGPHVRSRTIDRVARRRVVWRLRARYDVPILAPIIYGRVIASAGPEGGAARDLAAFRGGGVGIVIRPVGGAFRVDLTYAIDEAPARADLPRETVERLSLALHLGRW